MPAHLQSLCIALALTFAYGCQDRARTKAPGAAPPAQPAASSTAGSLDAAARKANVKAAAKDLAEPPHAACADCHPDQVESFLKTGMGRSLYLPETAPVIESFGTTRSTVKHPRMAASYRAFIAPDGTWWQEESVESTGYRRKVQVRYIIGSGNHSRSYLGLVDGELIQLPLTWYSQKKLWDMSPGYEGAGHLRFMRAVVPECLFCHNGFSRHVEDTEARYQHPLALGIDCARCHGDGTQHVAQRQAGKAPPPGAADPWILNPKHLPESRAAEVCQQCHLQGAVRLLRPEKTWSAYDPRAPLGDQMTVYGQKRGPGGFAIASQGERLAQSRCRTSQGKPLRCVSCHQPHGKTTVNVRAVCTGCHTPDRCPDVMSREPDTSCAECHMKVSGVNDAPHVSFTDHKIQRTVRRTPLGAPPIPGRPGQRLLTELLTSGGDPQTEAIRAAQAEVHHTLIGRGDRVELGHAVVRLDALLPHSSTDAAALAILGRGQLELRQFEKAHQRFKQLEGAHPRLVKHREFHGQALLAMNRPADAIQVLRTAVDIQPDFGIAWGLLGLAHKALGQHVDARRALDQAQRLMPADSTVAYSLGMLALQQRDPQGAYQQWQRSLKLDPLNIQATVEIARYLIAHTRLAEAKKLLEQGSRLRPWQPFVHFELGRIAVAEQRFDDAHRQFSFEQRYNPGFEGTYIERAQLSKTEDDPAGIRMAVSTGRTNAPHFPHWDRLEQDLLNGLKQGAEGVTP